MTSRHRIEVEATRRVRSAGGVRHDVHRKVFSFGKAQAYANGRQAHAAAVAYAAQLLDHASDVALIHYTGTRGVVTRLKASDRTFDSSWTAVLSSQEPST